MGRNNRHVPDARSGLFWECIACAVKIEAFCLFTSLRFICKLVAMSRKAIGVTATAALVYVVLARIGTKTGWQAVSGRRELRPQERISLLKVTAASKEGVLVTQKTILSNGGYRKLRHGSTNHIFQGSWQHLAACASCRPAAAVTNGAR